MKDRLIEWGMDRSAAFQELVVLTETEIEELLEAANPKEYFARKNEILNKG